jgi:hypothetical protein
MSMTVAKGGTAFQRRNAVITEAFGSSPPPVEALKNVAQGNEEDSG